jgi:hypothetical protein
MSDFVEIPPEYFDAKGTGIDLALLRRPRAVAALRRRVFSLPPTSKVRQRALARLFTIAWKTYERGDFSTIPKLAYAEGCELHWAMEARLDLPARSTGPEEMGRWLESWSEPFRDVRYEPQQLLDGGDVLFFALEMTAVGRASGAATRMPMHSAVWFEDGFVCRQLMALDRTEALRAAGFA